MKPRFKRYLIASAAFHVGLVVLILVVALIGHLRRDKRPHEIVTYVDLQAGPPAMAALEPVAEVKAPEPPPPQEDIPEPPKKPQRKPIEKSDKLVKRREQARPKPTALTPEQVRRMLSAGDQAASASRPATTDFPFSWYLSLVRQRMYEAWAQPSELAGAGLTAEVRIRVQKDGRITESKLVRPSHNSIMDQSVMRAVESVSRLDPLPGGFGGAHKDITIEFELTSAAL